MKLAAILILSAFPFLSHADANPPDISLHDCMSKIENQTTAAMNSCVFTATEAWDKELNIVYSKLMLTLNLEGKKILKESQIAWLKHRDLEYKLINSVYALKSGSMYTNMRAMNILTLTKNRTLELKTYLSSSE